MKKLVLIACFALPLGGCVTLGDIGDGAMIVASAPLMAVGATVMMLGDSSGVNDAAAYRKAMAQYKKTHNGKMPCESGSGTWCGQ